MISIKKATDIFLKYCKTRSEKEGIPEENAFEKIKKYVDQPGIFFHMSKSDSVWGVNVQTKYNTPAGIYLYPLDLNHYDQLIDGQLPFLASNPYIWIFKVDGNIIKSSTYSSQDLSYDIEKLKEIDDEKIVDIANKASIKAIKNHPLSKLFYIIYNLSGGIGSASIAKVTNLFKKLNYDGIFDDQGLGIIHAGEPIQAVIFSTKNCKPIEIVTNERVKERGFPVGFLDNLREKLEDITEEGFLRLPIKSQIAAVNINPYYLRFMKNPPEEVQLFALNQNPHAIEFIKNPSEKVQLAAVNRNPYEIRHIDNPSEALQLAAVKKDGNAIKFIKNPSEEVQLAAVNQDGDATKFIKNPSEEVQLAAVNQNGRAIYYIKNPSEKVQLAAVNKYGHLIQYIKNPSEAVQLAAVKENGYAIEFIKNPSEAVQLAAAATK